MSDLLSAAKELSKRLNEMIEEEESKKKSIPTIVNLILDKSGSMSAVKDATIEGFNEYIEGLKNNKEMKDIYISLTLFDSEDIEQRHVVTPIKKVKKLTSDTYRPLAATPLYDAVVVTLKDAEEKLKKEFDEYIGIAVIITDGYENASIEHNQKDFIKLKKRLEKLGNWTFAFLGSNQDSWNTASSLGYSRGNVSNYTFNSSGVLDAFRSISKGTQMSYGAAAQWVMSDGKYGSLNNKNFFK